MKQKTKNRLIAKAKDIFCLVFRVKREFVLKPYLHHCIDRGRKKYSAPLTKRTIKAYNKEQAMKICNEQIIKQFPKMKLTHDKIYYKK